MARIEIYSDFGGLCETIRIDSADPKDLRRACEVGLDTELDLFQCETCKVFAELTDTSTEAIGPQVCPDCRAKVQA